MPINGYDLEDTNPGPEGGYLDPSNAASMGSFDASAGWSGGVFAFGAVEYFVSQFSGSTKQEKLDNAVKWLVSLAENYAQGYSQTAQPDGSYSNPQVALSFSNDDISGQAATAGSDAATIQNQWANQLGNSTAPIGGISAPFMDLEGGYSSYDDAITMIKTFQSDSVWALLSDAANGGWTCAQMQGLVSQLGGNGNIYLQNYCPGNANAWADCGIVSGLGGVTVTNAASLCSDALGYQGGITNFETVFGYCPGLVLGYGAQPNNVAATGLICSS